MPSLLQVPFAVSTDHFTGSVMASVTLLQYGDYQCTHCGEMYAALKCLQTCLGSQLLFAFRHYPLAAKHPLALEAAIAAEAAAMEGKFWPMHNAIFEHQPFLVRSSFCWLAEELGLNMQPYYNSVEHRKLMQKVISDFDAGVRSGVDGTPTCYINGCKYTGVADFESLYQACYFAMDAKRIVKLGSVPG